MKKGLAVVVSVLICLQLCACESPQEPTEPTDQTGIYTDVLTEEMSNEIKQAWLRENKHGLQWYLTDDGEVIPDGVRYYGTYNGYSILFVDGNLTVMGGYQVGDTVFRHSSSFTLLSYYDGEFLELRDVYAAGGITDEDLMLIKQKHVDVQKSLHSYEYDW